MQIMITNGGPHPADKWAEITTSTILDLIQIDDGADTPEAFAARKAKRDLRPVLFDIFMEGCDCAQQDERAALAEEGAKRLKTPLAPHDHTDEIMGKFTAALAPTPFAAHFARPEVETVIRRIINQHIGNAMHIERRWAADRNAAAKGA